MSQLKNDLEQALKDGKAGNYPGPEDLVISTNSELVIFSEIVEATRWGHIVDDIVKRGEEHVRIRYEVPSGDSDCDFDPEFTDVVPYAVIVTKWMEKL